MTEYGQEGPFSPGDRLLEQYAVVRLLGTGGHAFVYECRDLFLDEHLAVKVIPNPPNRGRDLLNRARAEAQLLRRLSHPNVVRMHTAAALGEDMVCLVMEKLDGVTLRHLLALQERMTVEEAVHIVRQIAVGVAAAHELSVVHRDIKPDNAFVLPPNNHVKVLDFGIAKFLGHGLQTSNKYRFQGTPIYMSPEHLRGAGVTVRSDVYQLGTVMFELVTGINPNLLDLDDPGFEQIAYVQITRPTPSLRRVLADAPADLDHLIQKATAKDPEARFATMAEFIAALDQTMAHRASTHPHELHRIRYVDAAVMQAARELAEREAAHAWQNQTRADAAPSRRIDSTIPMGAALASIPLGAEPLDGPTDKMASYHPVPMLAAQSAGGSASSDAVRPRHSQPQPTATSARARKPLVSVAFVVIALGVGVGLGLLALLFLRRANGGSAASRVASSVAAPHGAPATDGLTTPSAPGSAALGTSGANDGGRMGAPSPLAPRRVASVPAHSKGGTNVMASSSATPSSDTPPAASALSPAPEAARANQPTIPADPTTPAAEPTEERHNPRLLTGDLKAKPEK